MDQITTMYNVSNITWDEVRFMEEVRPGIFRSTYQLQNFSWSKRLERYAVVEPGKKALLIDAGWDKMCGTHLFDYITQDMGVPWDQVMIFISHFHPDHFGSLRYCLDQGATCVMHEDFKPLPNEVAARFNQLVANHDEPFTSLMREEDMATEAFDAVKDMKTLAEVSIAGYRFRPLLTPGHTKGHLCLVEDTQKFIFAGDHIVTGNPLMESFDIDEHIIRNYLDTFPRLEAMGFKTIYMSHLDPIEGEEAVQAQLEASHQYLRRPLTKAFNILKQRPTTVWDLTDAYYANRGEHLMDLGVLRRSLRLCARLAFLEYLYDAGAATRQLRDDGALLYTAVDEFDPTNLIP